MSETTEQTIHATAEQLRNWGRWRPDDQLGTLNYIGLLVGEIFDLGQIGRVCAADGG